MVAVAVVGVWLLRLLVFLAVVELWRGRWLRVVVQRVRFRSVPVWVRAGWW